MHEVRHIGHRTTVYRASLGRVLLDGAIAELSERPTDADRGLRAGGSVGTAGDACSSGEAGGGRVYASRLCHRGEVGRRVEVESWRDGQFLDR